MPIPTAPAQQPIDHVVVLMLENASFDRMLGVLGRHLPGLHGIQINHPRFNTANGQIYEQRPIAMADCSSIGFDPGHEHVDAMGQLGSYNPATDAYAMDGFAQDAFTQANTGHGKNAQTAMNYFGDGTDPQHASLPVLQGLAKAYVVCDHWFSAFPGPTLPNRFFAVHGTAFGEVLMPGKANFVDITLGLELLDKAKKEPSIFSLCAQQGVSAQVYSAGGLPFSALSNGVSLDLVQSLEQFEAASSQGRLPSLSWIEPDYAFFGGVASSQHPPHDPVHGEHLIWRVYEALRQSPQWAKTLLVVTYDENGGFYDHVSPPRATAPDSRNESSFQRYGPRVPAVLVSPALQSGVVDSTTYDHTSVLAYVCDRFNLPRASLGQRVATASHFGQANIWRNASSPTPVHAPDATLREPVLPPLAPNPTIDPRWQARGAAIERLLALYARGVRHVGALAVLRSWAAQAMRRVSQ